MFLVGFLIATAVLLSWAPMRRVARAESGVAATLVGIGLVTLLAIGQAG